MKTFLYCYASEGTYKNDEILELQKKTINSAATRGGIDFIYSLTPNDIDESFKNENNNILSQKRGAGYWLWKYYFANILLNENEIENGDVLVYSDSKMVFNYNIKYFTDIINRDGIDIMTFWKPYMADTLVFDEKSWTKRDCFILMNSDEERYVNTMQGWAGFYIFKKTDFSKQFFKEALLYAIDYRILTDSPNELGFPNYSTFKEHRHDQSILSLLAKKHKFYPYRYPTFYIDNPIICTMDSYPEKIIDTKSTYPNVILYA